MIPKYKFVSTFDDIPDSTHNTKFYQICIHKNPTTKKYEVRKFIIDQDFKFVSVKSYHLKREDLDKLIKAKKCNEYKFFSCYDLSYVNYPTMAEINTCKSELFNPGELATLSGPAAYFN